MNNNGNFVLPGLGSILFAITVDCSELNVASNVETISPHQMNEIIIAVPTVNAFMERKSNSSKRAQVISFEDDDSVINNNISTVIMHQASPPKSVSLSKACLKYEDEEKSSTTNRRSFTTDSTYERITFQATETNDTKCNTEMPNETDLIKPESPTEIQIYNPITETYSHLSQSFDSKETDSSTVSKVSDSSSVTSSATTFSSNSVKNPVSPQLSQSNSMHSSIGQSSENISEAVNTMTTNSVDQEQLIRIRELEQRCSSLEEKVASLTL